MKNIAQITASLELARQHKQAAEIAAANLDANIKKIDPRFSPENIASDTAKLRGQFVPVIIKAQSELTKIADDVRSSKPLWDSVPLVMSLKPVTAANVTDPFNSPKDPALESATCAQKLAEFKLMSTPLLEQHAAIATAANQIGLLHLIGLEHGTRTAETDFKPLDLSTVALPDRTQALNHLNEIAAIESHVLNVWRASEGKHVNPADKIATQRMFDAAGVTA
jgi:hypothetical protein